MSGSLRGRSSEKMTLSNTSFIQGSEVPFESQGGGVMAVEVLQNEEIFGGGKNRGRKEVGSVIRR